MYNSEYSTEQWKDAEHFTYELYSETRIKINKVTERHGSDYLRVLVERLNLWTLRM